jgi:hypothetical protein
MSALDVASMSSSWGEAKRLLQLSLGRGDDDWKGEGQGRNSSDVHFDLPNDKDNEGAFDDLNTKKGDREEVMDLESVGDGLDKPAKEVRILDSLADGHVDRCLRARQAFHSVVSFPYMSTHTHQSSILFHFILFYQPSIESQDE